MKKMLLAWMLFLSIPLIGICQTRTVTGTVKNEKGEPVPGATVSQKGTTGAVVADNNGQYTIKVTGNNPVLVFTSVDLTATEAAIGSATTYDVSLKTADNNLAVVVVTALGISRKERSLGYSTQQVKGDNLTLTKEQNVLGSLAGKVAGVQVVGSSGASMGGTQKIKLRGVNSLNGLDQPLIVIDGTPISNANFSSSIGNGPDLGKHCAGY